MEPKALIELVSETLDKICEIIYMPTNKFINSYGGQADKERLLERKLEKIEELAGGIKFFIDKSGLVPVKPKEEKEAVEETGDTEE